MAWKLSIFRIDSPRYPVPLTFQMVYGQLVGGGAVIGLVVGIIWAVFISERTPSSVFWVSLLEVCFDIVRTSAAGWVSGMFITFFVWHLLWIASLLRIFPPIKWVTAFVMIAMMIVGGYVLVLGRRGFAEVVMWIGASLLLTGIAIWRVHILERLLAQKPKNEELVKV